MLVLQKCNLISLVFQVCYAWEKYWIKVWKVDFQLIWQFFLSEMGKAFSESWGNRELMDHQNPKLQKVKCNGICTSTKNNESNKNIPISTPAIKHWVPRCFWYSFKWPQKDGVTHRGFKPWISELVIQYPTHYDMKLLFTCILVKDRHTNMSFKCVFRGSILL